jgi:hypothetical protein
MYATLHTFHQKQQQKLVTAPSAKKWWHKTIYVKDVHI